MEGLFVMLRNIHAKIVHDSDRGERHRERHYAFLFLVRVGKAQQRDRK